MQREKKTRKRESEVRARGTREEREKILKY